jgi:PhoPQ-activated pathogenicity-related protein
MKRVNSLLISCLVVLIGLGVSYAQDIGPAKFFDMQEILNEATLNTVIAKNSLIASKARPGKNVRVIELVFTSQDWHGSVWKHPTRVYIPEGYQGQGNVGIIGTERQFLGKESDRLRIPGTDLGTEAEYAEGTAIDLGIPIMVFAVPAEDYFNLDESDLMGYAMKKLFETRDLTWYGYYPIIKAYLRAITLLQSLPEVRATRALLMGCSKRGYSVCVTTGVDPKRVAGVMSTCYFGGNTLYWIAMKFAQFGPYLSGPSQQKMGPGFQPADSLLQMFNNPIGLQLLLYFDPYMWRNNIKSTYLVAMGTNDEFYALATPNSMIKEMSGDKAFLAVDNTPHTWVSKKHLVAWRMWLAHTFLGRSIPKIKTEAKAQGSKFPITAQIDSENPPQEVRLFYSYNQTSDWRQSKWDSMAMDMKEGSYTATLDLKKGLKLGYYVEVQDTGKGGTGYVSSLVEIVE